MSGLVFVTGPVHLDEDGDDLRMECAAALTEAVGEPIEIVAERSYGALLERILAGRFAVAWAPPALFVRAQEARAFGEVLRAERFTGGRYQGAVFVREGSPIATAADLAGKSIAWVDRDSCGGYLFPRLALRTAGLDPDACFRSESFLESHSRVVRAVAAGSVDAGATHVQLADADAPEKGIAVAGWTAFAEARSMRAVLVSPSIPSDAVCLGASVPAGLQEVLGERLASFHTRPKGARLLRALLNADRLAVGSASDYAPVREALAAEGVVRA